MDEKKDLVVAHHVASVDSAMSTSSAEPLPEKPAILVASPHSAIVGVSEDRTATEWESMKQNPRIVFWGSFTMFICVLWGYDGLAGALVVSIPQFRQDFGRRFGDQYVIPAQWLLGFNGGGMASMFFGGLFCGWLLDKVGRRMSLGIACIISVGGISAQYFSSTPAVFLVGKMITGFTQGLFLTIAPAYISEISPTVLRGAFIASVNFSIVLGQLLAQVILMGAAHLGGNKTYKVLFAMQWFFTGTVLLGIPFMPESPWWLIRRGSEERARAALTALYGAHRPEVIENRLHELAKTRHETEKENKANYRDCFKGTDLRRTLIAMAVFVVQPLSGGPFVTGYQTYYFQLAGLPVDQTYNLTVGNYAVMLLGNVVGMYLCERVGRRPIMLWGSFLLTFLLVLIGILGSIPVKGLIYPQVVFMGLWGLVYQMTIGAVGWAVAAEVSTPRLRGPTQALCTMTNAVIGVCLAFTLPYMINPDKGNMGAKICFVFLAFMIPIDIWAWRNFPEFKGRSFIELDFLFHNKVATRKFKSFRISVADGGLSEETTAV